MTLSNLTLKRTNGSKLYSQLVDQLEHAIEAGELKEGERLVICSYDVGGL